MQECCAGKAILNQIAGLVSLEAATIFSNKFHPKRDAFLFDLIDPYMGKQLSVSQLLCNILN